MAKQSVLPEIMLKVPFFIIGIILGMLTFWVALMWVPGAVANALGAL